MDNTLDIRIEKIQAKILKLKEKIKRIDIALNGGPNPYLYYESDKNRAIYELEAAIKNLEKYQIKRNEQINLENNKIEAIEIFLQEWKEKAIKFYTEEYEKLREYIQGYDLKMTEHDEYCRQNRISYMSTEYRNRMYDLKIDYTSNKSALKSFSTVIRECNDWGYKWSEKLENMIEKERNIKRKMLILRVTEVTGKISDATNLYISENGEINGYVIGEDANASVNTIIAGGWNIQCIHFRVLVKMIKAN